MAVAPLLKYIAAASLARNNVFPFTPDQYVKYLSPGAAVVYGVNRQGTATEAKYKRFKQTIAGNKHFLLGSNQNTPQNTTGGALSSANQLRVTLLVDDAVTASLRARGDQVAPAGGFIVGAGGGTAAGDATLIVKGTTAANLLAGSTLLSLASTGANTKTLLPGDKINVAGDSTDYFVTGSGTLTLNGTTEINVGITPPIQVAQTANAVVTVTAASGKGILVDTAPAVGKTVEVFINDAADITQVTGGAFTANRGYQAKLHDITFVDSTAAVNVERL